MQFHQQLKASRQALGISQPRAAFLIGRSVRTLQNWEIQRNTPHPDIQAAVMKRLSDSAKKSK